MTQHLPTLFPRLALPGALAIIPWLAACSAYEANEDRAGAATHAEKKAVRSAMVTMAAPNDADVLAQTASANPLPSEEHVENEALVPLPKHHPAPAQNPFQSPHQRPSEPLTIKALSYYGEGCPAHSAAVSISADAEAFTLSLSQFSLELEQYLQARSQIKSCYLDLSLDVPRGWQIAVFHLDFRGYADLPQDGLARLDIKIGGMTPSAPSLDIRASLRTPYTDNFNVRRSFELHARSWSPCGQEARLAIDTNAILSVPAEAAGMLQLDSIDGSMSPRFGITWRRCAER